MKKGLKITLIILAAIVAVYILFNVVYKLAGGTSCCSCCDDSQEVCISACCGCTFTDKIEKIFGK